MRGLAQAKAGAAPRMIAILAFVACAHALRGPGIRATTTAARCVRRTTTTAARRVRRAAAPSVVDVARRAAAPSVVEVDVFIESTDCFGVAFYANYFKWLEYGLGERLTAVDGMKYKQPAVLGDAVEVRTTPVDDGSGSEQVIARRRDDAALITVAKAHAGPAEPAAPPSPPAGVRVESTHTCRHDDLDGRDSSFSLDACLRAFERSRSTFLGGPDELAALMSSGVTVVVASVDALRYAPRAAAIGEPVEVAVDASLQRTRIIFDQFVVVGGAAAASARVTCVCVNERGRPCAPPDAVLKLF